MSPHPGQLLREGFLTPLGITPAGLARGLAVERSTVSRLLAGRQGITPLLAARLGRYFQVPALWFLQMQAAFDAEQISADPSLTAGVTPRPRDRNFLLTPGGARPLGARSPAPPGPARIDYGAFDRDAPAPALAEPVVRQVDHGGGAVALVCGAP